MFDIGFWELMVIGIVGLLVIGPDKMPEMARTLGRWAGRARAYAQTVKNDIDRELRAQELRDILQPKEREDLYEFVEEAKRELNGLGDNSSSSTTDSPAQSSGTSVKEPS